MVPHRRPSAIHVVLAIALIVTFLFLQSYHASRTLRDSVIDAITSIIVIPEQASGSHFDEIDWKACSTGQRRHFLPFTSGDTFRCMADVIIDDTNGYELNVAQMSLLQIQDRPDVIFLKSDGA